ncbi:5346_t:CDS:2 [Ambispora gerdemannii]|uniref:5346_t:CDS:1 n=1 Tax=Ambispora gerdemannii TaxID=144530 RepID=A0A9N8WEA1_9GLOM|nr:5346_t:CDS:2 [Ambispora gerdemannii]
MSVRRTSVVQKNAPKHHKKVTRKFVIDASAPAQDKIFDAQAFEKFLRDNIKVNGRTGQLGDSVTINRDAADHKITVTTNTQQFAKRYLKYLTKKFMKKNTIRDWLRVVSVDRVSFLSG